MNLEKLELILKSEPKFRLKQAKQAIFIDLIDNWNQASNFPLALREKLNQECPLEIKAEIIKSRGERPFARTSGGSSKAVIHLADGLKIETVLLGHDDGRQTVCVSSQVGCPLACLFCATGKMGFKRNLTASEIAEQVLLWSRMLNNKSPLAPLIRGGVSGKSPAPHFTRGANKVNNVVFMGMGEPFLNYENVMAAIKILNDKDGLNIGARHISISTVGVTEGLKKIAAEKLQLNLALSLHAPTDEARSKIIPYNNAVSINDLIKGANNYLARTGRRLMIEYLMIQGFNDSPEQALALAHLLKKIEPPLFFVNLIAYNPTDDFKPSPVKKIFDFKKILRDEKIDVTERFRFGLDINAACGQLANSTNQQINSRIHKF